jgi:hypothetical protein
MQQAFRGRKTNSTQNVMVVVDFDLKFTYVLADWEGSTHDALILARRGLPMMHLSLSHKVIALPSSHCR